MSAALRISAESLTCTHQQFVAVMPVMENVLRYQFRKLPRRYRAEAISDGLAACWHAWSGLVRRGKDPRDVGPSGIAANACRYVRASRRLGTGTSVRGAMDVFNDKAKRLGGFQVISLDRDADLETGTGSDAWREWLVEDNRCTPADQAAFQLDFAAWLDGLPARKRQMAELLAEGHGTSAVARLLGVTLPAVSIARTWLEASWKAFQGQVEPEAVPADVPPVRRRVGRPRKAAVAARGGGRTPGTAHPVCEMS